jgi:hypothetical protein
VSSKARKHLAMWCSGRLGMARGSGRWWTCNDSVKFGGCCHRILIVTVALRWREVRQSREGTVGFLCADIGCAIGGSIGYCQAGRNDEEAGKQHIEKSKSECY